ncbi:MAG TPA: DUF6391 domain-containing protein [Anaerolineae bacterium]
MNLLDSPIIRRTRRNHALEHATIHLLSAALPGTSMAGRSTPFGFYLYGNVTQAALMDAAHHALTRLRGGEHRLAIHPGCGTNYLTAGAFSGLAVFTTLNIGHQRDRWSKLPDALIAATLALILSQPVGPMLQEKFTTLADMGDLAIASVRKLGTRSKVNVYYVETTSS